MSGIFDFVLFIFCFSHVIALFSLGTRTTIATQGLLLFACQFRKRNFVQIHFIS